MDSWDEGFARDAGNPPGEMPQAGEASQDGKKHSTIRFIRFRGNKYEESIADNVLVLPDLCEEGAVNWFHVEGSDDAGLVYAIGTMFGIHPLTLEDIVNPGQRPKIEDIPGALFITLKHPVLNAEKEVQLLQFSILFTENALLTFQKTPTPFLKPLIDRVRQGKGRIRQENMDYLVYAILDYLVDQYFVVLEELGDQMEQIEDELAGNPTPDILARIHGLKRTFLLMRRAVWPLRELASTLSRDEADWFSDGCMPYLRDLYDHLMQIVDSVETSRDISSGFVEMYLSNLNIRLNAVMKTLTIISTIFIPLTFISGLYGMNFDNMPELHSRWGYPVVLCVMGLVAGGMLRMFRKREWL